jgi:hypothetical protein
MADNILSHFPSVINRHLRAHDELTLNISKSLAVLHLVKDTVEATKSFCEVDLHLVWSLLDFLTAAKTQSDRMFEELETIERERKEQHKLSAANTYLQKGESIYHAKQARNKKSTLNA